MNEKWLKGDDEDSWYYMLENGDLYSWESETRDGMFNGEDRFIENLGEEFYHNPGLLSELELIRENTN